MTLERTPAADALTEFIIDLLRLNGLLVTAGDRMVARSADEHPLAGPQSHHRRRARPARCVARPRQGRQIARMCSES